MEPVTYGYSKANSLFFTIAFSIIIIFFLPDLIKSTKDYDILFWSLFSVDLLLFAVIGYITLKLLIPAFRGIIALEINSSGIISHQKNATIHWKDVKEIELQSGKTASLYIIFKRETDNGNHIRIPLETIAGNNKKICDTAMEYFEKST